MEPRDSAERAHADYSDESSTRIKDNGQTRFVVTKVELQAQEDSIMHEKSKHMLGYRNDSTKEEGGKEAVTVHHSCFSSTTNKKQMSTSPRSRRTSTRKVSMEIPPCMTRQVSQSRHLIDVLQDTSIQPPVTGATLRELDLQAIQHNINLRIDICYDPELFFQPISGRKGDEKRTEARRYWLALVTEFQIYSHNARPQCPDCQHLRSSSRQRFEPRLTALFDNLREIVQMLVPESDHEEVACSLDTRLLVQQVQAAAMDAVRLSNWLARLLTLHCAPMRDNTAAEVTELIQYGTEKGDMEVFVDGLEKLFGLLEAMKLDIANHQIRSYRYPLIDGTVDFQQEHFLRAIESQQIDVKTSQRWYRDQTFDHHSECGFDSQKNEASQRFACLIHGLVHLCSPRERKIPLTLQYDIPRITRLQEDLQDHIHMSICLGVFNQQAYDIAGRQCAPSSMREKLKQRLLCLAEDDEGNSGAISDHLEAIGMEITRAAFSLRLPGRKSQHSLTTFDVDNTSKRLHDAFQDEDCHQDITLDYLERLEDRTMHFAEQFSTMTTVEISDAQRVWAQKLAQSRTSRDVCLAEWDEMARKIAHIGVVHWRVWRDLCYWDGPKVQPSDEPVSSCPGGSQQESYHSGFCLMSISCDRVTEQEKALEEETAESQIANVSVQRYDSGLAEHNEESEGSSHKLRSDCDQGQSLDSGAKYSRKSAERRSDCKRSGEQRR